MFDSFIVNRIFPRVKNLWNSPKIFDKINKLPAGKCSRLVAVEGSCRLRLVGRKRRLAKRIQQQPRLVGFRLLHPTFLQFLFRESWKSNSFNNCLLLLALNAKFRWKFFYHCPKSQPRLIRPKCPFPNWSAVISNHISRERDYKLRWIYVDKFEETKVFSYKFLTSCISFEFDILIVSNRNYF